MNYKKYIKKTFDLVYNVRGSSTLVIGFRALLNLPFLPRKPDIPFVSALRGYINMIKCNALHRQYNFADIAIVRKNSKYVEYPFIVDLLKWSPSRNLTFKLQERQRLLRHSHVYTDNSEKKFNKSLKNLWDTRNTKFATSAKLFENHLKPFKVVISKFKISHQVNEVIVYLQNRVVLKSLNKNLLFESDRPSPSKRRRTGNVNYTK